MCRQRLAMPGLWAWRPGPAATVSCGLIPLPVNGDFVRAVSLVGPAKAQRVEVVGPVLGRPLFVGLGAGDWVVAAGVGVLDGVVVGVGVAVEADGGVGGGDGVGAEHAPSGRVIVAGLQVEQWAGADGLSAGVAALLRCACLWCAVGGIAGVGDGAAGLVGDGPG